MNQRGFVQLSIMAWGAIAVGAVIGGLTLALYVQTVRLSASKAEFAEFKGGVEALGRAAETAAKDKALQDQLSKDKADAQNARTTADLRASLKRLRDERAGSSFVSPTAAAAGSSDAATYDRAELERALRNLDAGVQRLVDEGAKAVIDLDTAKTWAAGRRSTNE